ncbi:hypothetical protein DFQ30_004074 [Apophysomyces sp. BC1015]|nr:hypothetical protein DFQ30_004074 [Apophysomyces sp. BC1015]
MSLCELEAIHEVLPRLRAFGMRTIEVHGKVPEHIASCDRVRDLTLRGIDGHLWGHYFARKYKNLEKLDLGYHKETVQSERTEAMILAKSCRGLKWFKWHSCDRGGHTEQQRLLEIFQQMDAPITNLDLLFPDKPWYVANAEGFHRTLSHVDLSFDNTKSEEVLIPLKSCLLLVEVKLYGGSVHIQMDSILDYWKHLKYLNININTICLGNNCTTNNRHGLKTLEMKGRITEEVFPYISQRCPGVSSLDAHLRYLYRRSCIIDLPNLNIERLSVSAPYNDLYRLSKIVKTEKTREYYSSVDKNQIENETRWFREDLHKTSIYELKHPKIETLSDQLCKGCNRCHKQDSKGSDTNKTWPGNRNGLHMMWIRYHRVDKFILNGHRVHCF